MSFALVDPFDFDLEDHKTIGFFLVTQVTFECSIVRITEKLWPVEGTDIVKPSSQQSNFGRL